MFSIVSSIRVALTNLLEIRDRGLNFTGGTGLFQKSPIFALALRAVTFVFMLWGYLLPI